MRRETRRSLKRFRPLVVGVRAARKAGSGARRAAHLASDRSLVRDYLERASEPKLQLGCGPNRLSGWLDTDLFPAGRDVAYLDASRPFPLPTDRFAFVFSEHQIEHLEPPGALRMLRECFRVLRRGGTLRLTTPDLRRIVALLGDDLDETQARYLDYVLAIALDELDAGSGEEALRLYTESGPGKRTYVVNRVFRAYGHRFVYDEPTLRSLLEQVGFAEIARREVGESEHAALRGLERHADVAGDAAMNRFETLVLEATKAG